MSDHRYDNPDLMPRDFLLAVMHDPQTSLVTRIDMAVRILYLDAQSGIHDAHPNDREIKVIIRIETVLGNNAPELLEREPEVKVKLN
jgi:hypothetical protein